MSLRARLVLLVCGLAVVLLGGLGIYLHAAWEDWARTILEETLNARADALADSLEIKRNGKLEVEAEAFASDPAHPFRVEDSTGHVLHASRFAWPSFPPPERKDASIERMLDATGDPILVLSRQVTIKKHSRKTVVLRVVAFTEPFLALERRFMAGLWVALLVALVLGAALSVGLARLVVSPIERFSGTVSQIGVGSLHERVSEKRLPPELKTLASSFNGLLSRLEAGFRRERDFVSRASHALRTPAATLRAQAEVALRRERPAQEYRKALEAIVVEAQHAARLTDELLALSRLDERAGPPPTERVELHAVAKDLRTLFAVPADQVGLAVEFDVPPELAVEADPVSLREALSNLLDNAIRYTPSPGRVGLRAQAAGEFVELAVWDTGPGISDEEKPTATERFQRGKAATAPGSGLGLAIASAIAEAHGASMRLEDNPGGGLRVTLLWPREGGRELRA